MKKKLLTSVYMFLVLLALGGCFSSSSNRSFYFRDDNVEIVVGEEKTLSLITNISNLDDIDYTVIGASDIISLNDKKITALKTGAVIVKAYSESAEVTALCSVNVLASRVESSLTFISDGMIYSSITNRAGSEIVFPQDPVKEDYIFAGWYTDISLTEKFTESLMPSLNSTLYARWRSVDAMTYTVTFHKNDSLANGEMSIQLLEHDIQERLTANAFTKNDYFLSGWATSPDGDVHYTDKAAISLSSNIDLYAVWAIKTYTITFDNFTGFKVSGWPENISAAFGASIQEPLAVPETDGYEFEYWYIYDDSIPYTFSSMPSGGVSLKAKWRFTAATEINLETAENVFINSGGAVSHYSFSANLAGTYYFYTYGDSGSHDIFNSSNIQNLQSRIILDNTVAGSRQTGIVLNAGETVILRVYLKNTSGTGSLQFYVSQTVSVEVRIFENGGINSKSNVFALRSGDTVAESHVSGITREGFTIKSWYKISDIPQTEEPAADFKNAVVWNFNNPVISNIILCPDWGMPALESLSTINLDSTHLITQYQRFGAGYFKFTAPETAKYYFTTSGDKDTYGYIFDTDGKVLYENDDVKSANSSFNFYIEANLTKGKVYILRSEIYGVGSSIRTGSYLLKIASNISYNISFNSMFGSSISNQYVTYGSYATEPVAPVREGFDFGGWYMTDSNVSTSLTFVSSRKFNFSTTKITAHTKLFAKWVLPSSYKTSISLETSLNVNQGENAVGYYTFIPSSGGTYYFYSQSNYTDTYAALSAADPVNYNMFSDEDSGGAFNFLITAQNLLGGKKYVLKILSYNDGEFTVTVSKTKPALADTIAPPDGIISDDLQYVSVGDSYVVYAKDTSISGEIIIPAVFNSKKVKGIGFAGFKNCTKITSVIISDGIDYIGKEAFQNCTALYSVEIPLSLTNVPMYVFKGSPFANYKNTVAKNNLYEELQEFADYIHTMLISNSSEKFQLNIIESNDINVLGYYSGGESVYINAKAYVSQYQEFSFYIDVLDTIAHETRHHWQSIKNPGYNSGTQEIPSKETEAEHTAKSPFFDLEYTSACSLCYWHHPMEIDARDFASLILNGANTDFRHKQYSQYYSHTYAFDSCYSYDFCSDFAAHNCFSQSGTTVLKKSAPSNNNSSALVFCNLSSPVSSETLTPTNTAKSFTLNLPKYFAETLRKYIFNIAKTNPKYHCQPISVF